jgi:iron complex outermembrane receptor protein
MNRNKLSLAVAAIMSIAPSVYADGQSSLAIEEVIVTAQKRAQSLSDVPATVSVVSADLLNKSVSKDFSDLARLVSGIEIDGASDGLRQTIRIRGIGTNPTSGIAPSVGIFVNDIPLSDPSIAYANNVDFERVEVLKGPQSTLFGKGVSSGAIVIHTRAADTEEHSGYLEANIGSNGLQEYYLGGNAALSDWAALRASLYKTQSDGQVQNITLNRDAEERDNIGGRIQLRLLPSDNFELRLGYEKHDLEVTGSENVAIDYGDITETIAALTGTTLLEPAPFDRVQQDGIAPQRHTDTEVFSLHAQWDINDEWSLTSISSYQDWERTNASSPGNADIGFDSTLAPFAVNPGISLLAAEAITQELRFNFTRDALNSVFGVFYSDSDNTQVADLSRFSRIFPAGTPLGPASLAAPATLNVALVSGGETNTEEWAIFTHNTYSVSDTLDITAGLRYSHVEVSSGLLLRAGEGAFVSRTTDTTDNNPVIQAVLGSIAQLFPVSRWDVPANDSESWNALTGALKANLALSDDHSVYASYSRGFKAGGFTSASHDFADRSGNSYLPRTRYDEEYSDAFEIGSKGYYFDRSLMLNASVYYQTYTDYQVAIVDSVTALSIISNAGEVAVQGAELEMRWQASENLALDASFAYVDSRFDQYEGAACVRPQYARAACDNGVRDLSGKRVNAVSPWSANFFATWTQELANGANWYLRGEYLFRDDRIYSADLDPGTAAPSYHLFNASAGFISSGGAVEAILWAKNLLDEDYFTAINSNADGTSGTGNAGLVGTPGQERSVGLNLKYHF